MNESFEENIRNLTKLEFYVLCPNGKRILAQNICKEFMANPNLGYAYRTFDNRLVIVVEAIFPKEDIFNGSLSYLIESIPEKLYWRQAFYLSTGESSNMSYTWLPFSGIVIDASVLKTRWREKVIGTSWFSKSEYGSGLESVLEEYKISMPPLTKDESKLLKFYDKIYGRLYLPETNFADTFDIFGGNPFDRWGCPSFVLASHALGGDFFRGREVGEYLFSKSTFRELFGEVIKKVNTVSESQDCFRIMKYRYPPTKILKINKYIDKYKAIPIMNAFREIGVFPPGLSSVQVPFPEVGYSIPLKEYYHMLLEVVYYYWKLYKLNKMTAEQIRDIFSNPEGLMKEYLTETRRKNFIFPNESEYKYTLWRQMISPAHRQFFGGTKKKRKANKKKSRKH